MPAFKGSKIILHRYDSRLHSGANVLRAWKTSGSASSLISLQGTLSEMGFDHSVQHLLAGIYKAISNDNQIEFDVQHKGAA